MKKRIIRPAILSLTLPFAAATISFAQEKSQPAKDASTAPAAESKLTTATEAKVPAQPSEAEMMKQMMELAKTGENHKLLSGMAGTWTYTVKMWMNPSAPPTSSTGSAVIKPVMEGRFFIGDFTSKMQMPGADGKMKDMQFKGMSIDGYDNVKKKFISTWCDSMGTGIMMSEGTYDPASKTFAYNGEYEAMPGMKSKVRMTLKIVDKDHHNFEFYEDRGTGESKTMEINYTRKK
jgi:uncharacterized protein DUF1579